MQNVRKFLTTTSLILFILSVFVFPSFSFVNKQIPAFFFNADVIGLNLLITPEDRELWHHAEILKALFEAFKISAILTTLFALISFKFRRFLILASLSSFFSGSAVIVFHREFIKSLEIGRYSIVIGSIDPKKVVLLLKLSFAPYLMILCGFLFLAAFFLRNK